MQVVDIDIAFKFEGLGYPYLLEWDNFIYLILEPSYGCGYLHKVKNIEREKKLMEKQKENKWASEDYDKDWTIAWERTVSKCLLEDKIIKVCSESVDRSKARLEKE